MAAVTAGLVTVFTAVPALYLVIKLAGAAYLLWLAWKTLRPGGVSAFAPEPLPAERTGRLFTMGLATALLNPKIAIIYVSLLPQFIDPSLGSVAVQSLLLGLTQVAVAVTFNGIFVIAAGYLATFLGRRPRWLRIQRYLMGTVLAGIAVQVATSRA